LFAINFASAWRFGIASGCFILVSSNAVKAGGCNIPVECIDPASSSAHSSEPV
jgi:hypothetical protein